MNKSDLSYLEWLNAGNTSEHFESVSRSIDDTWQTRRKISERAGVSINFVAKACAVLEELEMVEVAKYGGVVIVRKTFDA